MTTIAIPPMANLLPSADRAPSPRALVPSPSHMAATASAELPLSKRPRSTNASPRSAEEASSPMDKATANGKSPSSAPPPAIIVKKEPGSPSLSSSRPRPKRLDLSSNARGLQGSRPSAPLTSRDSAGLAIQDVGLACLSPGFQTNDPSMREQLQRSLDVRDQQRQIIEARQKGPKPPTSNDNEGDARTQDTTLFGVSTRTPGTARRKGPPPGLSIAAPAASQFANDRVIQSAPLHQTFTGLRPGDQAYSRHAQHGPSALGQTSHIHHIPATQTTNRLPPISDVFANEGIYAGNRSPSLGGHGPPIPSPGFPPGHPYGPAPASSRGREFRSAEEAVAGMSGGREDLMPKLVHYGGVQPPTPPSPISHSSGFPAPHLSHAPGQGTTATAQPSARIEPMLRAVSGTARRRGRDEYEHDNSSPPPPPPPLPSAYAHHSAAVHEPKRPAYAVRGEMDPISRSRDASDREQEDSWHRSLSGPEKKAEFLRLCERAWELFHS